VSVRDRSDHAREDMIVSRLQQLAPLIDGEPDPDFRAATRARLVAMAAVRTPAPEPVTGLKRLLSFRAEDAAPRRWRSRLTAGLAGAAMAVTAMATLVAVSTDAQPGDALYGLKRGTEQTQLALAGDARGTTLLDFASTRLAELEQLVDDGPSALPAGPAAGESGVAAGADPALVLETLRTMDQQTTEGAGWLAERAVTTRDSGPLEDLGVWAGQQSAGLEALQPRLPAEAQAAGAESQELLGHIAARVTGLQTALQCTSGPSVDGADAIGPVPALCEAPANPAPGTGGTPAEGSSSAGGSTGDGSTPAPGTGGLPVPPLPTDAPLPGGQPGTGPTDGGGSVGVPTVPGLPSVGLPTKIPLPTVTLPGTGGSSGSTATQPPLIELPVEDSPIEVCIPGTLVIGDC
jgi:Domain of unknown function (DUF5667)